MTWLTTLWYVAIISLLCWPRRRTKCNRDHIKALERQICDLDDDLVRLGADVTRFTPS